MSLLNDLRTEGHKWSRPDDFRARQDRLRAFLVQEQNERLEEVLGHPVSSREKFPSGVEVLMIGDMVFTEPFLDSLHGGASLPVLSVLSASPDDSSQVVAFPVRSREDVAMVVTDRSGHHFESEAVLALLANGLKPLSSRDAAFAERNNLNSSRI